MKKNTYKILIFSILIFHVYLQQAFAQEVPVHPRGLILAEELPYLKKRLQKEPLRTYFANLKTQVEQRMQEVKPSDSGTDRVYLCSQMATLYLLSEDQKWADLAWEYLDAMISTDVVFNDPLSRGLTRAALLMNASMTYDFCYSAWSTKQRKKVNDAIYENLASVNSNMGFMANYNMASNWMGVRYGAVLFAAKVWDPPTLKKGERSPVLPYLWDAGKRLRDHIDAVIYDNGWNGESMGYHQYDWSFMGPALIALNNASKSPAFHLENFTPKLINTPWALSTAAVDIPTFGRRGMKADLSDDNFYAFGPSFIGMAMRLYPKKLTPYLKWVFDYRFPPKHTFDERHGLIHALLYYPLESPSYSPEELGWLHYHDPEQGIVMFRNQFKDSTDIVMTMSATSRRVRGHQGPDTHTWRLFGLGVPWVIGGGRTGATYLQTNLFTDSLNTPLKKRKQTGTLHHYAFYPEGGESLSSGSCMNVRNHQRYLQVDYKERTGCEGVFLFQESSDNGERWRIQTPEFNEFKRVDDGFILTAPNGSRLRAKVLSTNTSGIKIKSGLHRYGGKTVRLNFGLRYENKSYENSRWIDVYCEGDITILVTLEKADAAPPTIKKLAENAWQVGEQVYYLNKMPMNIPGE